MKSKRKLPKRNPFVAAVLKKAVRKHKNRKRDAVINGQKESQMIFSTDPDFLRGWDDYTEGRKLPPNDIRSIQTWYDGYIAHEKYQALLEKDNDDLYELSDLD